MNSSNQQTTQDVNDTHCTGETLDTQRRALLKATGGWYAGCWCVCHTDGEQL